MEFDCSLNRNVTLLYKKPIAFLDFCDWLFCLVCFFFLRIHHHLNCVLRADELAGQPLHILGSDLLQGFTVRQHVIRMVAHAFGEGGHPESIGGAVGGVLLLQVFLCFVEQVGRRTRKSLPAAER